MARGVTRLTTPPALAAARDGAIGPSAGDINVDALVALYAPLGRRRRRTDLLRRVAAVVALLAGAVVLGIAARSGVAPVPGSLQAATPGARPGVAADGPSRELALLRRQMADMNSQRSDLERQRQQVVAQQAALDELIRKTEAERRDLARRMASSPGPKGGVETGQRNKVDAQSALVARELGKLNEERGQLERQRRALDQQRSELQVLMRRLDEASANPAVTPAAGASAPDPKAGLHEPAPGGEVPTAFVDHPSGRAHLLAGIPVVDDGVLGATRGGLRTGDGYDISFGLTRSGSVNGVEQFSSSLYVGDMGQAAGALAGQPLQVMLIQNGAGNMVPVDALNALAGGVGSLIQNTLDGQSIQTKTVLDISLSNVSSVVNGITASDTVSQSLGSLH